MRRARNLALWALLPLAALFLIWPGIDLWFSRLFLRPDGRFPADTGAWHLARMLAWDATVAVALFSLAMLVLTALRPRATRTTPRLWGFATLSFLLGPGLLTNLILKANWGRARPQSVLEFGGPHHFTPPILIAHECSSNCSFVSGEASGAVTLALVLGLILLPGLGLRARAFWAGALGLGAGWAALLRIMTGRHFLSDTLFAADLMVIVVLTLWLWLKPRPASLRTIGHDLLASLGPKR